MAYMSSDNYVWTEKNKLGQGACGAVYRAWHRDTGDLVAVKTFPVTSSYRVPRELQNREFEILNGLSHENIVRLLATETVGRTTAGGYALIMELCEGGSLLDVLDEPVNACGLEEEEFLLVLQHLTAGLKYLRQNDIVHRDIKPGNIMRHVTDTGRSIYKIADFGTARQLEPEAEFQSLCGTEEYLNPQLYRQAVLRRDPSIIDGTGGFSAVTDLWSVGVTLYHCATGQLPFRSYEGRTTQRGKETVYKITTGKESGVISGVQSKRDGPISWSRELPQQCRLSRGLRLLVTALLAGLLECLPDKMWTFERYFSSSEDITDRRVVYVFDGRGSGLLRVYLGSNGSTTPRGSLGDAKELRRLVEQQTSIKTENQLILFNGAEVGLEEAPSNKTTPSNPLFVYVSSTVATSDTSPHINDQVIPSIPDQPVSTLPDANYLYVTACCEVIHYIRHTVAELLHNSALLGAAAATYRRHLVHHMIATQRAAVDKYASMSDDLATRLNVFVENESMQACESLIQAGDTRVSECMDMNSGLGEQSQRMRAELRRAEELLEKSLEEAKPLFERGSDVDSWRRDENLLRLDEIIKSLEKQKADWKSDRNVMRLPDDRQLDQKYGRKKLPVICSQAQSILADWCLPGVKYRQKLYGEWMKKTTRLRMELKSSEESLDKLREMRKVFVEAFDRLLLCHHPTAVLDHHDGVTSRTRAGGYAPGGLHLPKLGGGVRESSSTPNLHQIPHNSSGPSGRVYSSSGTSSTSSSNTSQTSSSYVMPDISELSSRATPEPPLPSSSELSRRGFDVVDRNVTNIRPADLESVSASSNADFLTGMAPQEAEELLGVLQGLNADNLSQAEDVYALIREQNERMKQFSPRAPAAASIYENSR